MFAALREKLTVSDHGECVSIEHDGARLVRNPIKSYERPNLKLMQAGLGAETPQADIVRVFNVLLLFRFTVSQSAPSNGHCARFGQEVYSCAVRTAPRLSRHVILSTATRMGIWFPKNSHSRLDNLRSPR